MSKIVRPKTPFEFCAYPVLKEALEKTNYNQTELAQSLGTSQFTVSAWVRGDRDTTVRLLLALEFDRLDELVGLHSFDDCALYGYALKLRLLERQRVFRHDEGKAAFDTLLGQVRQQIFSL